MMKLVIFACLCASVLVAGQDPPPPPPPNAASSVEMEHNRVARQAMPAQPNMQSMPGQPGGNAGDLSMQGLGNIPDPTAVIAKAQEVGRQFISGRRRRQAGPPSGPPDGPPGPPPTSASSSG